MPPPPHILVLYNLPTLPPDHHDAVSEHDIVEISEQIAVLLRERGFTVSWRGVGRDPQDLLEVLRTVRPDAVFNLFEGFAEDGQTEATAAGLMEWLMMPFTGSPSQTLSLSRDKMLTKHLLLGAGLPTAAFAVVDGLPCPKLSLQWPVIVKPANQDGSVGIEQANVVSSQEQLEDRIASLLERFGPPVLVEEFIPGREFHVTLIEEFNGGGGPVTPTVVPLTEVVFEDPDPTVWPIYSFDAKWTAESREFQTTPLVCPVPLAADLQARIDQICRDAYRLLGCRDYARVDLRMTPEGKLYILEVNPNPYISSYAVIDGLEAMGRTHPDFIVDVARRALARSTVSQIREKSVSVA